jgi:hypothetical protein
MTYILGKNCSSLNLYTMTAFFSLLFIFKVWVGPRFSVTQQPKTGIGRLIVELSTLHKLKHARAHTHTHTHCTTPLRVLSSSRSGCYQHNTRLQKEKNINVLGGIRTHDPTNRAPVDLSLTQHCHRDRRPAFYLTFFL